MYSVNSCLKLAIIVWLVMEAHGIYADEHKFTFGFVPQQSATVLAKRWIPVLREINKSTKLNLVFATAPDIPTFEKRLLQGEYDFAYMNPYHYTVFSEKPGYRAFAKQKDKWITGIIVVAKDSSIESIHDLEGRQLAFPSPAAFAASILTQGLLKQNKVRITPKFVSSHDSVYRAVAAGLMVGGGGIMRTFNTVEKDVSQKLRVLTTTPKYTPHAFAYHPRMKEEVVQVVAQAFYQLAESEQGSNALKMLSFTGVEPAEDQDWNDVREINITHLDYLLESHNAP